MDLVRLIGATYPCRHVERAKLHQRDDEKSLRTHQITRVDWGSEQKRKMSNCAIADYLDVKSDNFL
jgi:hypothetical protein